MPQYLLQLSPDYDTAAYDELDTLLESLGLSPAAAYARPGGHAPSLPLEAAARAASAAAGGAPLTVSALFALRRPRAVGEDPYVVVTLPSAAAASALVSRAVLIKGAWELWARANGSLHSLVRAAAAALRAGALPPEGGLRPPAGAPWRFHVSSYGLKVSEKCARGVREHFFGAFGGGGGGGSGERGGPEPGNALGGLASGPVALDGGDGVITFSVVLHCARCDGEGGGGGRGGAPLDALEDAPSGDRVGHWAHCSDSGVCWLAAGAAGAAALPGAPPPPLGGAPAAPQHAAAGASPASRAALLRAYFGVALPVASLREKWLHRMALSARPYLGPTSLEPQLALLMASLARSGPGCVAYDPCVGTGSLVLAAAALGATTCGSDIDARVLGGKLGRTLATNFAFYGLPGGCDVWLGDFTLPRGGLRGGGWADAIVTDPPYGVRAHVAGGGAGEGGSGGGEEALDGLLRALLDVAARLLRPGGRLVYLLPAPPTQLLELLPSHPLLSLRHVSEEPLAATLCRLVVTMERLSGTYVEAAGYAAAAAAAAGAAVARVEAEGGGPFPRVPLAAGKPQGVKAACGALMDAWYLENRGREADLEAALRAVRGGVGGDAAVAAAPRRRLELEQRRLRRQSERQQRQVAQAAARADAAAAAAERRARKEDRRLLRLASGGGGGGVECAASEAAPAAGGVTAPPPAGGERLSISQRKAARRAQAERDDAAGVAVRIAGVAYDPVS
jgi:hypothetical protein